MSFLKIFVTLFRFDRTNWKAVALCFLAAAVFWIFNALNKTYSTHLRFPLRLEYDEARYAPAAELPTDLLINVSGNGWDLFRKSFGVRLPELVLPLERPTEVRKIVAATLPALLAGQLGSLHINFVVVDTLRIRIDNRVARRCAVKVDGSALTFREQLGRSSPFVVLPDSVLLSGPESILNKIPDTLVVKLPAQRVGNAYREEVEVLVPSQEFIRRNPPVVEVRFEVSQMEEISARVMVEAPALPWGQVLETDSVQCVIRLPQQQLATFDRAGLRARVEPVAQKKGEERNYRPELQGLPPYARLLHIDSVKVRQHAP